MLETRPPPTRAALIAPVAVAQAGAALWLEPDGEVALIAPRDIAAKAALTPPILCHGPEFATRLKLPQASPAFPHLDILELFAFVRPAAFCLPTVSGVAAALGLNAARGDGGAALILARAAEALLGELDARRDQGALAIARTMARAGWSWGPLVLKALGAEAAPPSAGMGFDVWSKLPEWAETAPLPPPGHHPVAPEAARARLKQLLGPAAEDRPRQADYAAAAAAAFAPREQAGQPTLVLAEAGTGIGKTLGYLAPASLWAEQNDGAVWVSTFTRNLQRQIDGALARLYPDPRQKALNVVVRKGRENYLCLLNFDEAGMGGAARQRDLIALGLVARWAGASRDGDMVGGDFPAWLTELFGARVTLGLTDRRGECIYSACPHYRKCFIERNLRKARRARIVVANHALVMAQAAAADDSRELPTRLVFDEAHHVFDAADSAFSAHLSGAEAAYLRRWILGPEGGRASRGRGLTRRVGDLVANTAAGTEALEEACQAARCLPGGNWEAQLADDRLAAGRLDAPAVRFFAQARRQVFARSAEPPPARALSNDLECPVAPALGELIAAAAGFSAALAELARPLDRLMKILLRRLDAEAAALDAATRLRIDAMARGIERRLAMLETWRAMLGDLGAEPPPQFVDWLSCGQTEGSAIDVGLHRHWLDPMRPFAEAVLAPAHGALMTSASLTDAPAGTPDWQVAEARTGARHLALPAARLSLPSPFDYANRSRVFIVNDVDRHSAQAVAAAYRELFLAAGGGGLGLFTAIARLKAVHGRIVAPLAQAGLALYAQHVDAFDTATLVDIFREEADSCLLGTDAVRDGVDVPGAALRLIVFDRVPWPRPDLLHKARRQAQASPAGYDDMLTRLKLKQAFGRLLRQAGDRGVFVVLDARLPSRLLSAFPPETEVSRLGLAEAILGVRAFFAASTTLVPPPGGD